MSKLKMKKIEIIAPVENIKSLMDYIQQTGVVELKKNEGCEALSEIQYRPSLERYIKYYSAAEEALAVLSKHCPEKVSLLDSLAGKKDDITLSEYLLQSDKANEYLGYCYDIIDAQKVLDDSKANRARINAQLDSIKPWLNLDVPMMLKGTKSSKAFIGSLPKQYTEAELKQALSPALGDEERYQCEIVSSDKTRSNVFVVSHCECADLVFSALRELGFAYPADPTKHPPKVRFERLNNELKEIDLSCEKAEKVIKQYSVKRQDIKFAADYFAICRDKYESLSNVSMSSSVFVISGYVTEENCEKLTDKLESKFGAVVSAADPGEDEDVPVELKNNSFNGAVESITKMYSMPGKNDIDPNPVMAFFYYALFGIMLSDAGYGLLMVIGTAFAKLKMKPKGNFKKTVDMYFYCGIATVFWGSLFGSWFGDIVNVVARDFFGIADIGAHLNSLLGFDLFHGGLALWFEPVADPMKLMLYSFLFGIIHLFFGLGASFYNSWRQGNKLGAICDVIPVYLFVLGVAPLGAGIVIDVPPAISTAGKYLMIAGAVLIVLTAGRSSKNILGKFGLGLYGLYNTTSGWLSDILSYSRLLALGLCTGVIAQVVNQLGTIPQNTVVKACVLVPVFLFGHTVNMAINLIGTYVHTNRLQYVEFFAKFYEGGGRCFTPLKTNTKYFNLKED